MVRDNLQPDAADARRAMLLGLGLDNKEGERRVTLGKNFLLAGGSEDTHALMQEKAVKFNEELDRRKKRLDEISPEEFHDIAEHIRLSK
jgi:hypothetical protein